MIFKKVKHFFKRYLCVESLYIDDRGDDITPTLRCKKCGREIGFIYSDKDRWKPFLYTNFKWYKPEIERWVYEHTKDRNHMGNSYEQEWGEMLHNLKQWRENSVLSMGCEERDGECEENSKSCESGGFGGEDGNIVDKLYAI